MTIPNPSIVDSQTITARTGLYEIRKANEVLLQNLLNGSLILGTVIFFINLYNASQTNNFLSLVSIVLLFGVLFIITFVRILPYRLRVYLLATIFFLIGALSLVQTGLNSSSFLYFFISVLIVGLLLEKRFWIIPIVLIALTVSVIGFLIYTEIIRSGSFVVSANSITYWISISINLLYISFLITASIAQYFQRLRNSIISTDQRDETLVTENQSLANKLIDFQNALDRRRSRLVTTRQISREISQQTDLDKLLRDSVDLIHTQLGFYYAAIFLNDDRNENTILRAATGEAGRIMLDRNYRIRVRDEGIVGFAIYRGEPRISVDIDEEYAYFKNPSLPNTKSEIAIPLRIGQHIFGALDVHSDQKNSFGDEDIEILQAIADQLSTVIDKTTQIQGLNHSIETLEEAYRSYTRGTWQTHLKGSKSQLAFTYTKNSLESDFKKTDLSDNALLTGEVGFAPASSELNSEEESIMAVPIILRDQVLGVMNIKYKGKNIPNDLADLVHNASDRLALALENARLLEQIQERAEREHLVGEISTKVRAASDINTILRTAASELGKSLGIDEVRIQLKNAE